MLSVTLNELHINTIKYIDFKVENKVFLNMG